MPFLKNFPFFFLLLWAGAGSAFAAPPVQYKFSLIDVNSGLSHNMAKCFLKDSRGFMWIGTGEGLNRYDGYNLKIYRYNSKDTSSLVGNGINNLFEDPEGNVWVQTNYGLNVYNPKTEKFHRNLDQFIKKYHLSVPAVENIIKDKQGNYWFIQTGSGLTRYNPETHKSQSLVHAPLNAASISSNYVSGIAQNSRGDFWLIHRNGMLEKLDGKTLKVIERRDDIRQKLNQSLSIFNILIDSGDDLWVYSPNEARGVFFLENATKDFHHIQKNSAKVSLNNNFVRGMAEEAEGFVWIGTDHGGINVVNKKDFSVSFILHSSEVKKSLAHNTINTLYKDNEGIIWVGTSRKGVNYYHENLVRFAHFNHQTSVPESLPFDEINAFAEDKSGNLWIGTNGGGLLYHDRSKGTYKQYLHNPDDPNTLSHDVIVSLLVDRDNVLWVGTYLGGLDKLEGGKFTNYKNDPENPESLSDDSIWELYQDISGNIWIGTLKGGLELFDTKRETFRHFQEGAGEIPLHCDYITALEEDKYGNLWVGGGYGIDMINSETGKSTYFFHDPAKPGSLAGNNVHCIYNDSQDNIWVGTSDGLSLYNSETGSFKNFTEQDGLPGNTIITILEDEKRNLWLSTPNGLVNVITDREKPELSLTFRNYDEFDGLQGKAFNDNAALKTRNGELVFGGPNGYNIFRPQELKSNLNKPEIVFTDFQLFNQSLGAGENFNGRIILPASLQETENITLEHDENVFSIEFATLNYFHPQKNRYKYKLEGFDKDWLSVQSNNRRVTYTNLDPGKYTFKVIASNNDGLWNKEGKSLQIAVMAPFWKTGEAYVVYFIIVLIALYVGRQMVLQRERMKFQLEQERREARQLHELDLMKIRFFTNVSHEFRTPLALILAPLERLLSTAGNSQQEKHLEMIQRNAKRLLNLVNQLLDFRKLEVEGISFYPSEGNIIKFIEESVNSFSGLSEKKNISLSFKTSIRELHAVFDMDKLEKIIFNLMSNAFKFTPESGRIEVEAGCFENDSGSEGIKILELKVTDNGIGIPKEKHEKIFERFFRNEVPASLVNQGSGIGLSITKEFVKVHGGTISLKSEPGAGSCFTVHIPLKPLSGKEETPGEEEMPVLHLATCRKRF